MGAGGGGGCLAGQHPGWVCGAGPARCTASLPLQAAMARCPVGSQCGWLTGRRGWRVGGAGTAALSPQAARKCCVKSSVKQRLAFTLPTPAWAAREGVHAVQHLLALCLSGHYGPPSPEPFLPLSHANQPSPPHTPQPCPICGAHLQTRWWRAWAPTARAACRTQTNRWRSRHRCGAPSWRASGEP